MRGAVAGAGSLAARRNEGRAAGLALGVPAAGGSAPARLTATQGGSGRNQEGKPVPDLTPLGHRAPEGRSDP